MSRKVVYSTMNTIVRVITVTVDDDASLEDIAKKANLYANLHGWDEIYDNKDDVQSWVTEVPEDEPAIKNPIYS